RPSPIVPQEETLAALDELVRAGKVRWVGASTFPAWMVMEGLAIAARDGVPAYVSEQPPYNLLDRRIENELVPLTERYGLALIPWSPLGGSVLTGRYAAPGVVPPDSRAARRPHVMTRVTDRSLAVTARLGELARDRGLTMSQLALLWCKDQPGITAPIVGPRTMSQLEDALAVLPLELDDDAHAACDDLVHPGNAIADYHTGTDWMQAVLCPA